MIGANEKNGSFYALKATDLASGPVWSRVVGSQGDFFNMGICTASAAWDSTRKRLFVGSNQTVINSQTFSGAVRALDPGTGGIIWETVVTAGPVMGSPTLNGAGVLAAGTYSLPAPTQNKVYLLDASTGAILTSFEETSPVFAQPVFADSHLFIATTGGVLTCLAPPTKSGRSWRDGRVMLSAEDAQSFQAWGNAPGCIRVITRQSAESAVDCRHP